MDTKTFVTQAGYGEEAAVREALTANPELARARNEARPHARG